MRSFSVLRRQRGFSAACVLISLLFFSFVGFLGIRLASPYSEYRMLSGAVDDVLEHEDVNSLSTAKLIYRIKESVHGSSGVSPSTSKLENIFYVSRRDGHKVVGFNYEVAVKLFYNMSVLLHFKHEGISS